MSAVLEQDRSQLGFVYKDDLIYFILVKKCIKLISLGVIAGAELSTNQWVFTHQAAADFST